MGEACEVVDVECGREIALDPHGHDVGGSVSIPEWHWDRNRDRRESVEPPSGPS